MKRILACAFAALLSISSMAATLTPIQLLQPAGSTSGQFITSTGPTTAPAWATVTLSGLGGLAKASNLSDLASVSTARTNLGLGTSATVNTGTSGATIPLLSTANTWTLQQAFTVRPTFNSNTPWDSGNLAFATPPAIGATTPAAGAFTTLSATGLITPTSTIGIKGTAAADSAQAGSIGEYPTPTNLTGVSLTSSVASNCASISLTAGDWDVSGVVTYIPAGTTVQTNALTSINTVSATRPGVIGAETTIQVSGFPAGLSQTQITPTVRESLSATTTVFLVCVGSFTTSTMTANGFIRARRVR